MLLLLSLGATAAPAQGPGGSVPVGFARALERDVRQSVELTGSVESRSASVVAASVAGVVIELAAREGERVRRGAALVRLRPDDARRRAASAAGELDEARAGLRLAEGRRERAEGLFADQVISRQQLDDALSEYEASVARVTRLEADLARFEDEVERTVIRAPFSGVVVEERVAVGEWVSPGSPVAYVVDPDDLELAVEVPEQFFGGLRAGHPVRVAVPALGAVLEGEVRAVVPSADPRARTFPVKIALHNPKTRVGVGMLASVALPVGEPRPAVLVPKDAIVGGGATNFIYLLSAESQALRVDVEVGPASGNWVAVVGDVEAGDAVIVQGNERLQPGQPVSGRELVMEQP